MVFGNILKVENILGFIIGIQGTARDVEGY